VRHGPPLAGGAGGRPDDDTGKEIGMATVRESFEAMPGRFRPDKAAGTSAVIQYDISGEGGGTWNAVIKDGACVVNEGQAANPNLTLSISAQDWLDMLGGKQSGQMLFMSGKLKVKGDMGLAMKLGSMFSM
jgi:putative sterol carrier protein